MWQLNPYAIPLTISGCVALFVVAISLRQRRESRAGALALALLALFASVWSFGYALELSTSDRELAVLLAKIEYIAIAGVPLAWFGFAQRYTGRDHWLRGWRLIALCVPPALTQVVVWTNELHGLFWTRIEPISLGDLIIFDYDYGPWFWVVHTAYSYACLAAASVLLFFSIFNTQRLYRLQLLALLIAIFTPWLVNLLFFFSLLPWPYLDLTPVAFTISSLAISLSVLRFRLLDIVPLARGLVLEQLSDRVMVVDSENTVVDINRAATESLHTRADMALGRPATELFARWLHIVLPYSERERVAEEVLLENENGRRWYELRIAPFHSRAGRLRGRVVLWREITDRKEAAAALLAAKEAAEAANRAKSVFLANLSQELRTPLASIQEAAERIELRIAEGDTQTLTADLAEIRAAGDHLLAMIRAILDQSRFEATSGRNPFLLDPPPGPGFQSLDESSQDTIDRGGHPETGALAHHGPIDRADLGRGTP